ncbi:MAG: trypsin-like peptidase domain-containing protein [Clostridium sp.]|nr:trypsin-like peptidase domain-containing protein [Clostridium sp.]
MSDESGVINEEQNIEEVKEINNDEITKENNDNEVNFILCDDSESNVEENSKADIKENNEVINTNIYTDEEYIKSQEENSFNESNNEESTSNSGDFEGNSYVHPINDISNKNTGKRKKIKNKKNGIFKVVSIALITGLLGGLLGGGSTYFLMKNYISELKNKTVVQNPATFEGNSEALTAVEAFQKVAPAVVIVSVSGVLDYSGIIPQETEGIGSGFIINEEGYILTNYHVIEGAKEVKVTLSDEREVAAKVVNYDENQDVAMLKISDDSVKVPAVVELGDSDALQPGEQVIAIGTPLSKDFNQTVTSGIVSAVNRVVETTSGGSLTLIQTDEAINPGNIGGPLVNTIGEVIGINNMKIASDEVEGIGFSIPINSIKDRIESLSKPILNLGISVREVNSELAKRYNLEEGLYIVQVTEFSPAEVAGLQSGDVIVKFDGKKITTFDELKTIRDTKEEGDIVSVEVVRDGKTKTFDVKLEAKN